LINHYKLDRLFLGLSGFYSDMTYFGSILGSSLSGFLVDLVRWF